MIKITNGKDIFEVSNGAFEEIYSRQGYAVVDENKSAEQDNIDNTNIPEKTEDEKFADEIIEKPISQWSKEEVKRFAVLKGIDLSGTKNVGEGKELIKQFLNENV